jgi:hypothetical protein
MDRLRCGTIYTDSFASYLREWWRREPQQQKACVPSLEYIFCKEGPRKGEHWMTLSWMLREGKNNLTVFDVAGVPLHLSLKMQRVLKSKCLDTLAGQMVVRS